MVGVKWTKHDCMFLREIRHNRRSISLAWPRHWFAYEKTLKSKIWVSWVTFECTELLVGAQQAKPDCTRLCQISHRTGTAFHLHGVGPSLHLKRLNSGILVCWVNIERTELMVGAQPMKPGCTNLRDHRTGTLLGFYGPCTS